MQYDHRFLYNTYYKMLLSREYEQVANQLFQEKAFGEKPLSGIGQEAVSVGAVMPLRESDYVAPTLRSKGAFLAKGLDVRDCFLQLFRRKSSLSGGVWTAHHMGDMRKGIILSSALVASVLPVAAGVAMASQLKENGAVTVAFFGDGACSRADFHTTINLASVRSLPMVFVCENNLYALSTPIGEQMKNPNIAERAIGYGIPGVTVDGQDVLAVLDAASTAIDRARSGKGPTLLVCNTYRYRGHTETHDPIDGRPREEYEAWLRRDPIQLFKDRLLREYGFLAEELESARRDVAEEVRRAVEDARNAPDASITDFEALVYAD